MTTDNDITGVEPPKPPDPQLPLWQSLTVVLGALIAFVGLGVEILNYRHMDDNVPRALTAVIIGGAALMAFPVLIKLPGTIRMWRRL